MDRAKTNLQERSESSDESRRKWLLFAIRCSNMILILCWAIALSVVSFRYVKPTTYREYKNNGLQPLIWISITLQILAFLPSLVLIQTESRLKFGIECFLLLYAVSVDLTYIFVGYSTNYDLGKLYATSALALSLRFNNRASFSLALRKNVEERVSLTQLLQKVISPVLRMKSCVAVTLLASVVVSFQQPLTALLVSRGAAATPGEVPVGDIIWQMFLIWIVTYGAMGVGIVSHSKMTSGSSALLGRRLAIAGGLLEGDAEQLPSVFSQGIAKIQQAWDTCFYQLFPSILKVVVQFIFLAVTDFEFTLLIASFVPLIQSLQHLKQVAMSASKHYNKKLGEQQLMLTNMIDLRETTKMLQAQVYIISRWDDLAAATKRKAFNSYFWATTYGSVLLGLNNFLYIFGVIQLLLAFNANTITLQELIAANGYLYGLISPLNGWANAFNKLLLYSGPVKKLAQLSDGDIDLEAKKYPNCTKRKDKSIKKPIPQGSQRQKPVIIVVENNADSGHTAKTSYSQRELTRDSPDVIISNATFTFPGAQTPALDNLSLKIPANCFAALVGPSGSGKTTLLRILGRVGDKISNGHITVGGVQDPVSYEHTSTCLQHFVTLNSSVKENIIFGSSFNTEEDIVRAAKAAEIHNIIMNLKKGYDTIIGSGSNITLSGGQLARLGLARALCRRPRLLLCDEITSPLDAVTEEAILLTLKNLHQNQGLTIVLCTHSMNAAAATERVYVMVKGKLGQPAGSFKELSTTVDSPLYKLVNARNND